jgi:hypothetical protein
MLLIAKPRIAQREVGFALQIPNHLLRQVLVLPNQDVYVIGHHCAGMARGSHHPNRLFDRPGNHLASRFVEGKEGILQPIARRLIKPANDDRSRLNPLSP